MCYLVTIGNKSFTCFEFFFNITLSLLFRIVQVLPIVYTSGGKEFQMVNPQAVDLVSYEERLKTALNKMERLVFILYSMRVQRNHVFVRIQYF